ncbi:buccalin-like [Argopecten irradians]|uniref:buccalin-like n=1 Tax=Argopecten irradians TaxID=31199 RepID=UPI00371A3F95
MTNGQHRYQPLKILFAVLCLVIVVHSSKESLQSSNPKAVNTIQKRNADTGDRHDELDYSSFNVDPVKRSTDDMHIDDLLLPDSPEKRGRGNRYGFYGTLGKRSELEDIEKRRMRKMFYGSLGKRRPAFFAALGKRNGDSEEEIYDDDMEKRGRSNRYFFGTLGKRNYFEGDEDDDDGLESMDKRGRSRNFGFYGTLGKRDGTSVNENADMENGDEMEKRRYRQHFFGTLGKRDGELDLEKRRRYGFATLGKRFDDDLGDDEDIEKRRMKMRPAFYGALGKRRQMFFGTLGKRSASSPEDEMFEDQTDDVHSRRKRSLSTLNLSRALRGSPSYGRARRYNRRITLGRRLIRRTQDFRFFPQLGKRSTFEVPQYSGEY